MRIVIDKIPDNANFAWVVEQLKRMFSGEIEISQVPPALKLKKWTCKKCGFKALPYPGECGTWFWCNNESCENFDRMRIDTDSDFLEYFQEE